MNISITYDNVHITSDEHDRLIKIEREYNALVSFLKDHMMTIDFVDDDLKHKSGGVMKYKGDGVLFTKDKHYKIDEVNDNGVYVKDNDNYTHLFDFEFIEKYFEKLDYIHSAEIGDYLLSNIDATGLRKGSHYHIYDVTNKLIRYMDDDNCPKSYVKIFHAEYKKRFTLIKNYNK
jgi:hypothetical protein